MTYFAIQAAIVDLKVTMSVVTSFTEGMMLFIYVVAINVTDLQENSQVIYFEVGRTNLFHVLTTSLTKSSATITNTNITHKFTFYIPK